MYVSLGRWRLWVRSPVTTHNFPILYFVTVLIRGTIIKFRGHRGFIPEFSSAESPVCTTAVQCDKMTREMVVYKSVWTQREKKDQRSELSTTGLRSRIAEFPRAFAGSALSECLFSLFKLCCLCLGHVSSKLSDVSLGSGKVGVTSVDLSSVFEPIQGYLLSGDSEGNFFTDPESFSSCMELLETFSDRALQRDYNIWELVNVHGYEKIRAELEKSYKAVRVASDVESSSSVSEPVFVSERLPERRLCAAQRPRIDIGKTHHSRVAHLLAGKMRPKRKASDAESS